jgi:hypothetical protein
VYDELFEDKIGGERCLTRCDENTAAAVRREGRS